MRLLELFFRSRRRRDHLKEKSIDSVCPVLYDAIDVNVLVSTKNLSGLISTLCHNVASVRLSAKKAIISMVPELPPDGTCLDQLIEYLGTTRQDVSSEIMDIVAELINYCSDRVILALKNDNQTVRWRSAEILGRCKVVAAVPTLIEVICSEEIDDVTEAAVWALNQIGGDEAERGLQQHRQAKARKHETAFKNSVVSGSVHESITSSKHKTTAVKAKSPAELEIKGSEGFGFTHIAIIITKSEILNRDITFIKTQVEKITKAYKGGRRPLQSLGIGTSAYDKDSRALFEIPEMRKWCTQLRKEIPYIVSLLDDQTFHWFILCIADIEVHGSNNAKTQFSFKGNSIDDVVKNIILADIDLHNYLGATRDESNRRLGEITKRLNDWLDNLKR